MQELTVFLAFIQDTTYEYIHITGKHTGYKNIFLAFMQYTTTYCTSIHPYNWEIQEHIRSLHTGYNNISWLTYWIQEHTCNCMGNILDTRTYSRSTYWIQEIFLAYVLDIRELSYWIQNIQWFWLYWSTYWISERTEYCTRIYYLRIKDLFHKNILKNILVYLGFIQNIFLVTGREYCET